MEKDLSWLFSSAGQTQSAQKYFSDRIPEYQAFDLSILASTRRSKEYLTGNADVQDLLMPRQNILHFFGMGGIGKTELLKNLRYRALSDARMPSHWEPISHPSKLIVASYNLAKIASPSVEGLLIQIRQALASQKVNCRAFDLLFSRYWAAMHPSENLEDYISSKSQLKRLDAKTGLSDQIQGNIGELASSILGVSIGISGTSLVKIIESTLKGISKIGVTKTALQGCKLLEEMLEAPVSQENLSYYCSALAWDIFESSRVQEHSQVVVFLDHLEEVSEQFEYIIQQVIWLLPNVLFVTTGRNKLRWSEDMAAGLFRKGRSNWPGLHEDAESDPRQHRVGPLDDTDTMKFLTSTMVESDFSYKDLKRISDISGGLPYYLDLIIQHWTHIRSKRTPAVEDFLVPFPDLTRRVVRDLSTQQRKALFAAALFDAFDRALVSETASVSDGVVKELAQKPIILKDSDGIKPFSLDKTIRNTLLVIAQEGLPSWSKRDWTQMASRALINIKDRIPVSTNQEKRFFLKQALQIADRFQLDCDWIVAAAKEIVEISEWDPNWNLDKWDTPNLTHSMWLKDFGEGLETIFGRQSIPRDTVANKLKAILSKHKEDNRFDVIWYFFCEASRDAGDLEGAKRAVDHLLKTESTFASRATHASIHLLRRKGKFVEAAHVLKTAKHVLTASNRLRGDILWTQAKFEEAANEYRAGRIDAQRLQDSGEAWLCSVSEAFCYSWIDTAKARSLLNRVSRERPAFFSSFASGIELLATFLSKVGSGMDGRGHWFECRNRMSELKHSSLVCYFDLAGLYAAEIDNELDWSSEAYAYLQSSSQEAGIEYLCPIAQSLRHGPEVFSEISWLDDQVLTRWRESLLMRKVDCVG